VAAAKVYEKSFEPIVLKELATQCDIGQLALAEAVGAELGRKISRPTMNLVINHNHLPPTIEGFQKAVEKVLGKHPEAVHWLAERNLKVWDVWQPLGREMRMAYPKGYAKRTWAGRKRILEMADPTAVNTNTEEQMRVEALHPEAMKRFRLFRNPFVNEIASEKDIYMSEEHRYIEAAMLDAANHGGFLAVIGEVGSGKSIIRKRVVETLHRDGNTSVIYPENHRVHVKDKFQSRIDSGSLCDAIIMDISDEPPKLKTEHKVRQLKRLLVARSNQGYKHVLIIEEAHNLTKYALKYLKQFHEIEDGFKKLLSIVLIGQPELSRYLDEQHYPELRELAMRVQVAQIVGLNGSLKPYIEFKFKRAGVNADTIFAPDFYEALTKRLTFDDGRGNKISHAYPGIVNVLVVNAMNLAYQMGEAKVSADVVMAL